MTPEQAAALRAPFPSELVGTIPKGGAQLSYVGHAAVTDRLLQVDPEWTWEPMAFDDRGSPALVEHGKETSLWIRLTICGVTRPAVGTALSGAFELPKQLISDAIRNGAMRAGVALDLWSKEELHTPASEPPKVSRDVWDQILAVSQRLSEEQRNAWKAAHPMGRDMPAGLASKALEYGLALVGAETAGDAADGESEAVLDPGRPFEEAEG